MNVLKSYSSRLISNAPGRLYRGLPAIVLGTLFNVLDTVSTGLLLFPTEEGTGSNQFKALQIQSLSMFIMSTILSQVAMTLGGSRFPGALGAMLIEILPFLRGVGSDIRGALGSDHPGLVPTVMATYALTSFLTGFAFIMLGILKLGNLVAYFPQTVLTGAIGAIGLSLFILGLGLMLPESSPALTLSSAGSILFSISHFPLLVASFVPALVLSVSKRSQALVRWTRGATNNPYFIPMCLCSIPAVFWIVAGSTRIPKEELITHGWLFRVDISTTEQSGIGTSWIYWREFNFSKVEWWALRHAITNIILLVVIGVLNLPIFVPALAFTLDVSYDMNHEFLGQGVANILAGIAGTVPNILQYSYSVFVTRVNGGRVETTIITMLTFVLFFTSSLLLPYVPTVLASTLVLFIGMELLLEAVWESARTLVFLEWAIVMGTLLACTFLGFAEGFGIGIGAAAVVYLVYGVVDSRARVMHWEEWNETHGSQTQGFTNSSALVSPAVAFSNANIQADTSDIESATTPAQNHADDSLLTINARVVILSGYVFFASIPSLETKLLDTKVQTSFVIVDLTLVHRLETSAAQCFDRAARDLAPRSTIIVFCGVKKGTGVHADFERAGVTLVFNPEQAAERGILTFGTRAESLVWCQQKYEQAAVVAEKGNMGEIELMSNADIYQQFCKLFNFNFQTFIKSEFEHVPDNKAAAVDTSSPTTTSDIDRLIDAGVQFIHYHPGQIIAHTGGDRIIFVIEGELEITTTMLGLARPSVSHALMMLPRMSWLFIKQRVFSRLRSIQIMGTGSVFNCSPGSDNSIRILARSRCVTVEVESEQAENTLIDWAQTKTRAVSGYKL